jgi:hypothetical protein
MVVNHMRMPKGGKVRNQYHYKLKWDSQLQITTMATLDERIEGYVRGGKGRHGFAAAFEFLDTCQGSQ